MQSFRNPLQYSRRQRQSRGFKIPFTNIVLLSKLSRILLYSVIGGILFFFFYFIWISRDLPTPGKLSNSDIKDSTKILDKNGVVLYSIYKDVNRLYVPLNEIPKDLQQATISTEDKNFYKNKGYSITGLFRGLILDPIFRGRATGGSTITQQLVKNVLLSSERSLTRKVKELILAIQVDQKFTKDQILEMYLNNVSYGGTSVGVEAASSLYFGKRAKELDLAQSAFLAGLPQSPSFFSPLIGDKSAYIDRTKHVLDRLKEDGYITQEKRDAAMREVQQFKFTQKPGNYKAPHFVEYVRKELESMFGENVVDVGNLTVKTTLDYEIEKKAEDIVATEIEKLKTYNVGNGAAIVMDPKTGGILAMVGSKDYFNIEDEGNFNASTSLRQPGSSLKPLMYAAAFEKGYTPATLIMDLKTDFLSGDPTKPTYTPVNYDGKYRGPIQLRFALGNSINVPAVKMLARVGIKPVMQKAYDMGIENWKPTTENINNVGLSLVLGGREASLLEIVSAYSVFANQGVKKEPFAIVEVKDRNGKVIFKHQDNSGQKILDRGVAFLISHILLDNNARELIFGSNSLLNIPGHSVSVKTGTTDSKRDNWAVGYTPSYVVGSWVGNNDNSVMNPAIASGVTGATPIWRNIMIAVLKGVKSEQFPVPDNVKAIQVDAFSGGLPIDGKPTRTEYFIKGTEPTTVSPIYKKLKISRKGDNNKLANADEIEHGDFDVRDFVVFYEDDPVSTDGKNRWQEAIDKWINETYLNDSLYHPPTETSDFKYD
ncbi:MAG: penicillin-binding protein [Candidatus Levybacteria bacterium CG10_big_fil_rev_8_21_14_0_10_36_7]|nr:MAG: penicillin-binding protein [Candidatus Levybacteria bacterium CG10_big_fil_rev_8_21_14_0_10_36_7]